MTYSVKEMYYTLQGEGAQVGRAAVFLRFAGCNLWTGREKDREKAICKFCDTQFVGTDGENGGKFKSAEVLAERVMRIWNEGYQAGQGFEGFRDSDGRPYVVCTGGEPLLQLNNELIRALHGRNFEVGVETNGTVPVRDLQLDWICVSPKADSAIKQDWGDELKLVYPQIENKPEDYVRFNFKHFFLSPRDTLPQTGEPSEGTNEQRCVEYCLRNPKWRLSLQTHKILGLK